LGTARGRIVLYDKSVLKPLGTYTLDVSVADKHTQITFDIIEQAPWPIIDGRTCVKQGWIQMQVHAVAQHSSLTKEQIMCDYKDVFTGLGCLPGKYHIDIDPEVKPVQHAPRRVPVPLKAQLKAKILEMEEMGVIEKVNGPSEWISSLVAVKKGDNKLRLCMDPRDLNKAIRRPKYQIPTVEEVLPNLARAKIFSVVDAKDGFFQIELDQESSELTTFWTPFGKYRYKRCPFGISSAPEEYQRRQKEVLEGLLGVDVIADDIICFGSGDTTEEAEIDHDNNMLQLLERARKVNLKLNSTKLKYKLEEVEYMGHLLTKDGVKPDPHKVEAILKMPRPQDAKAVQRLLGTVNYLAKFLPCLSEVSEPLRRLTRTDTPWHWETQQEEAYQAILKLIVVTPVLRYYDVTEEVTVQADSSDSGLGAVLLQNGQPVAFASRALSTTEQNYAQIEKECLAIVFACERFDQYLHGRDKITGQTDHKPLETIVKKLIHQMPKRLQRMVMRLQKYNLHLEYLPGTQMFISDMLSRAYLPRKPGDVTDTLQCHIFSLTAEDELFEDIAHVEQPSYMRLAEGTQEQIKRATQNDPVLQELASTILLGWPETRSEVPVGAREYWSFRDEMTVHDGIVYRGMRVVVPKMLRSEMVNRAHSAHLGQEASIRKAKDTLYWPGMDADIKVRVENCEVCSEYSIKQAKEPMMTHNIPILPWTKVGQDLFSLNGESYLVTVDFFSDFFEVDRLSDTTSQTVIECTKRHFAAHGKADIVSDNGPQFTSQEFQQFTRDWEIKHITSSPYHSRSNGKAESAVKIAKRLLKKSKRDNKDFYMCLLEWRNVPDVDGYSPVQKLNSRRTRTTMPTAEALLKPQVASGVYDTIVQRRRKAKAYYDRGAKRLPELEIGETVRLQPDRPRQTSSQTNMVQRIVFGSSGPPFISGAVRQWTRLP
jgi:hypothetical protein